MRVSLNVTNFSWRDKDSIGENLIDLVHLADESGVDTVWVSDHLVQSDPTSGRGETEMLEAYTSLGFLAGRSVRVRLGTMVTGVTFRPPSLLVKAVTTLDVLSGGRAWLGIGAGYLSDEAHAMGLPLPPTRERFERLEETLKIARQMWCGDDTAIKGEHYQLANPSNSPAAVQRPHPPILIGGAGERRTLRLVAQYADACNLFDIPDGGITVRNKLRVLFDHCQEIGRPFASIDKTISTRIEPGESPVDFANRCREMSTWGIKHAVVLTRGPWTREKLSPVLNAIPQINELAD